MKKANRTLIIALSCVLTVALAACSGGGTASQLPDGHAADGELPAMEFTVASSAASTNEGYQIQVEGANLIAEKSGGKLQYNIVWDGTLGNDSELIENCMTGSIPLISLGSSPFLSYIPEIAVFDMPAVFDSVEGAYEGIGQFKDVFNDIFREKNLQIVGMSFYTFRGLSSSRSIQSPADFQGMSIRTLENKYHMDFWSNLGANPTPLAFSELYLSLQQGLVDAQDNPVSGVYASKFYEVQDFYMPVTAFPFVNFIVMNRDAYDALPEEYQALTSEFADYYLEQIYVQSEQIDDAAFEAMGDAIAVLPVTDAIQAAMKEAAQPVWEQIAADIGSDITEAYLATAK